MSGQPGPQPATATAPASLEKASAPSTRQCAQSCMDYLLIALVHHYQQTQHQEPCQQDGHPPLPLALDAIGIRIGRTVVERLTHDRPPFADQLDMLKWICKDFWSLIFGHQVDNLRTNHRGTYVLRDTRFRWTLRIAQNFVGTPQRRSPQELTEHHLILPCAIVKGALRAFGIESTVTADSATLPQIEFTVVVME